MARFKDPKYFLLGTVPTSEDKSIVTAKLPTYRQVLLAFLARREEYATKKDKFLRTAAKETIQEEVLPIYEKADIKMKANNKCEEDIIKLHKELFTLLNINKKRRESLDSQRKFTDFKEKLSKTMPFWSKNSTANKEDQEFLENMSTTRTGTMIGKDTKTQMTVSKREKRKAEEQTRVEREKARKMMEASSPSEDLDILDNESNIEETEEGQVNFECTKERKHTRLVKTGQTLFIPPNVLSLPEVNSCATRNKISPTVMASITSSIISGIGGDPNKFHLSYGYSYR